MGPYSSMDPDPDLAFSRSFGSQNDRLCRRKNVFSVCFILNNQKLLKCNCSYEKQKKCEKDRLEDFSLVSF